METSVECTHCRVFMTSWSVPGSPVRYYQCPFCSRTLSSHYREVFRTRAGARLVGGSSRREPTSAFTVPALSLDEIRWAGVKARAARWFARLEQEERRCVPTERVSARHDSLGEETPEDAHALSRLRAR